MHLDSRRCNRSAQLRVPLIILRFAQPIAKPVTGWEIGNLPSSNERTSADTRWAGSRSAPRAWRERELRPDSLRIHRAPWDGGPARQRNIHSTTITTHNMGHGPALPNGENRGGAVFEAWCSVSPPWRCRRRAAGAAVA